MEVSGWREVAISGDMTLTDALMLLNSTAAQILLVVNDGDRLEGTVTDGDIRRALLRGALLSSHVRDAMNASPAVGAEGMGRGLALSVMRRLSIHALPMVDADQRVRGLLFDSSPSVAPFRNEAVVIMAGGRGERLRPLTDHLPKPLVRVGGVPLAEATVRRLGHQGFQRIWLAVHYRGHDIEDHFGDGAELGVAISYLREHEPLGTVGAVTLLPEGERDCVLVVNGDLITAIDFGSLVDTHLGSGAVASIGVVSHVTELPYGVVREERGYLVGIDEKPAREDLISAGVAVLSRPAVEALEEGTACDMPQLLARLVADGQRVAVVRLDDYWLDIGTQKSLAIGRQDHSLTSEGPVN